MTDDRKTIPEVLNPNAPGLDITLGPGKDGQAGFADLCRLVGEKLTREHEAIDGKQRAADDAESKLHEPNAYYVIVRNTNRGTSVEIIGELPFVGAMPPIFGRNYEHAIVNVRMQYAAALLKLKLLESFDDARAAGARLQFRVSMGDL